MFIPDPGSWFLPIPDTFLCSHKFHKIEHYFSFEAQKTKILANFQRNKELFTQKIFTALKNIGLGSGIRDSGSGKNLLRIPEPGVKRHRISDPGSGSATLLKKYVNISYSE